MKKTIISFLMAMLCALMVVAAPAHQHKPAGKAAAQVTDSAARQADAAVIIHNGDTVRIKGGSGMARLNDIIEHAVDGALDDTLYNGHGAVAAADNGEPIDFNAVNEYWSKSVSKIVIVACFCLVFIVLLVVWFRYLTRRRKYRMIEKAIENNYPLTDAMLGDTRRTVLVQQPARASMPAGEPVANAAPAAGAPSPAPQVAVLTDWSAYNPALKWGGIGCGLLLFGVLCGAEPFTAVGLALMVVGAVKGYICYRQQQEMQQWRAQQPQQSQQPQQPQGEPMREGIAVPPPFDNNNEPSSFN